MSPKVVSIAMTCWVLFVGTAIASKMTSHKFEDFKTNDVIGSGIKLATPVLKQTKKTIGNNQWEFRTTLVECGSRPVNFAGHFTTCSIGVGNQNQINFMIDRLTGQIFEMPQSTFGFAADQKSNLLVVNPDFQDQNDPVPGWLFREYYVWTNNKFDLIDRDKNPTSKFVDNSGS